MLIEFSFNSLVRVRRNSISDALFESFWQFQFPQTGKA